MKKSEKILLTLNPQTGGSMSELVKVTFLNNVGTGFAEEVTVAEGTTAAELFGQQMGNVAASAYKIRVNRLAVAASYVLQDGDRMTVSPEKIEGA